MTTPTPAPAGLDELDALLTAATPGEWEHNPVNGVHTRIGACVALSHSHDDDRRRADAALIVALRNRAPAMLAAIRATYALAKEMAKAGEQPDTHGEFDRGVAAHQRDAAARLRIALDEALAGEAVRWYVHCGCGTHGDHGGCSVACQAPWNCRHPIGSEITAATEAEADWRSLRPDTAGTDGAALIAAERRRQIDAEGWTPEHDARHWLGELAMAAVCYAWPPSRRELLAMSPPVVWPWRPEDWKPKPGDRVRELVKAGALIAAEIDRLRAAVTDTTGGTR